MCEMKSFTQFATYSNVVGGVILPFPRMTSFMKKVIFSNLLQKRHYNIINARFWFKIVSFTSYHFEHFKYFENLCHVYNDVIMEPLAKFLKQ